MALVRFSDKRVGVALRYNADLAIKFRDLRTMLQQNNADEISIIEVDRWELLQMHFSWQDEITVGAFHFDTEEIRQVMLKRFPQLIGYYENIRNAAPTKSHFDTLRTQIELDPYFTLQEPLMSGYSFLPNETKLALETKTGIDFGGYNGFGALMLSDVMKHVCVLEPTENFDTLKSNIKQNSTKNNIDCYKLGVDAKSGVMKFCQAKTEYGSWNRLATEEDLKLYPNDIIDVPVVTIDDFVKTYNIDNLGLLKFDIEGAEYDALLGGINSIKKFKPVLLVSIYHYEKDFFEIIKLIDSWQLGYKYMMRNLVIDSNVWWTLLKSSETVLICY